jgi:hypothetical protein
VSVSIFVSRLRTGKIHTTAAGLKRKRANPIPPTRSSWTNGYRTLSRALIGIIINRTDLAWADRKFEARKFHDPCPAADTFNPDVDRITGLINDYVEYANAMKAHFPQDLAPRLSFHWNVIAWWEWIDDQYLDQLHASVSEADFPHALLYLQNPTHHDSQYLGRLVDTMCANGTCQIPLTWTWTTPI